MSDKNEEGCVLGNLQRILQLPLGLQRNVAVNWMTEADVASLQVCLFESETLWCSNHGDVS